MFSNNPFPGDAMFSIMPVIIVLFFILFFGIVIFSIYKGVSQWKYNNNQPVLSVQSRIVSKRADVSTHHHNHDNNMHHSSSTYYYVTFEVESGDRIELRVPNQEFGMLVEGDIGKLTFQGTRYHKFERMKGDKYEVENN